MTNLVEFLSFFFPKLVEEKQKQDVFAGKDDLLTDFFPLLFASVPLETHPSFFVSHPLFLVFRTLSYYVFSYFYTKKVSPFHPFSSSLISIIQNISSERKLTFQAKEERRR